MKEKILSCNDFANNIFYTRQVSEKKKKDKYIVTNNTEKK